MNLIESISEKANLRSMSDDSDETVLVFELITKDYFSSIIIYKTMFVS